MDQDSPLHVDALVGSQQVQTVEDSVTGDLDVVHWRETGHRSHTSA